MDKYVHQGNSFRGTENMFDASWAFSQMQESHLHSLQESGCFCVKTTVQSISTRRSVVSQHPFRWPFRPAIPREGVTIPVQEARTATRCVQEPFFGLGNPGKTSRSSPNCQATNEWIYTFCRLFCARTLTKIRQPNHLYLSISNCLNLWWPADDPSIWIDLAVLDWLDCFGRCIVVLTQCFCVSRVWGGWWRSFTHGQMKQIQRSKRCHIPSSLVQFRSKTTRTNRSFKSFQFFCSKWHPPVEEQGQPTRTPFCHLQGTLANSFLGYFFHLFFGSFFHLFSSFFIFFLFDFFPFFSQAPSVAQIEEPQCRPPSCTVASGGALQIPLDRIGAGFRDDGTIVLACNLQSTPSWRKPLSKPVSLSKVLLHNPHHKFCAWYVVTRDFPTPTQECPWNYSHFQISPDISRHLPGHPARVDPSCWGAQAPQAPQAPQAAGDRDQTLAWNPTVLWVEI